MQEIQALVDSGELSQADLDQVLALLGPVTPGAKLQFFTNPRGSLAGLTPVEAIKQGELEAVLAAAEAFAEPDRPVVRYIDAAAYVRHRSEVRQILARYSEHAFDIAMANRSGYLGGRRPLDVITEDPELVKRWARMMLEAEDYAG